MEITQLWRYPVKSMIGELVEGVDLDELGVIGDRTWAARDLERGGIRGAKKIATLMQLAARDIGDGQVEISLPDGSTVLTTDPDVDERVSAGLDHSVRLERLRPAEDVDHYRRGAPDSDDVITELRGVFGRVEGEPLPDFSIFPAEMNDLLREFESPPGTYYDAFPLMVITEQALAALQAALPDSIIDGRRFRPSIVIDADQAPASTPGHPEFDWAGRRAQIGSAVIEFAMPCPRCIMVTRQVNESIPRDLAVLRHVVRDLDQNVGIYATITKPGTVNSGDQVTLL
ncbi:MAG: MOSC domain-containing protein [Actinomycetia bacterium]|nr:MOSC domain-containing protein [Actinomycetes bacterium]MCP5035541.1 MOSC domain-containing protein [Actinomycetes bacterium]